MINEKTLVSTATLIASLASYFYAKESNRDVVPFVMVGGFIGAILGEVIVEIVIKDQASKKDKDKEKNNEPSDKNSK